MNIQMVLNVKSSINLCKKKSQVTDGFMVATNNQLFSICVHIGIVLCAFLQELVSKVVFESRRLIMVYKP